MCEVDLTRFETVPRAAWETVMVVMPAFAQCHNSDQPIVAAVVGCVVVSFAPTVTYRVHSEGHMPEQHRIDKESPYNELRAICSRPWGEAAYGYSSEQQAERRRQDRYPRVSVKPTQLRITRQIFNFFDASLVGIGACQPPMMSDSEAFNHRRMKISFLVGDVMMTAMVGNPPQRASLCSACP